MCTRIEGYLQLKDVVDQNDVEKIREKIERLGIIVELYAKLVEVTFNSYRIIPHYYNTYLHFTCIHLLFLF